MGEKKEEKGRKKRRKKEKGRDQGRAAQHSAKQQKVKFENRPVNRDGTGAKQGTTNKSNDVESNWTD